MNFRKRVKMKSIENLNSTWNFDPKVPTKLAVFGFSFFKIRANVCDLS